MKFDIKKIARKATSLSELMNGREKIETETLIKYYPNGITISNFEEVPVENNRTYVYIFEEDDKVFAFSGTILTKIFDEVLAAYGGDYEEIAKDLHTANFKVKLSTGKTKKGQEITLVEII